MKAGQTMHVRGQIGTWLAWNVWLLEGSVKGRQKGAFGKKHGLTRKYPLRGPAANGGRQKPHF